MAKKSEFSLIPKELQDKLLKIGKVIHEKSHNHTNHGLCNISIFDDFESKGCTKDREEIEQSNIKNLEEMFKLDERKLASSGWR